MIWLAIAIGVAIVAVLGLGCLLLPPERGDYPPDDESSFGV